MKRVLWQRHITPEIERIRPKAIHMLSEVGTETGNRLVGKVDPFRQELLEHAGLGLDVVEDQTVGHHVPILDNLALFVPIVLGNDARPPPNVSHWMKLLNASLLLVAA